METVKIFSVSNIVPVVDAAVIMQNGQPVLTYIPTGEYTPILGAEHLPFELCSLQLFFMLLVILFRDQKKKQFMYAIIYPTGIIGGLMGIVLSSTAAYAGSTAEFFTSPRMWQFFLSHSMIVSMGIYVGMRSESGLTFRKWRTAVSSLIILDIPSFFINSVLSNTIYVNDKLIGVTHRINFFSSYVNPLGIVLTEKWQWIVYLLIRFVLAVSLIVLVFLPFRRKEYGRA